MLQRIPLGPCASSRASPSSTPGHLAGKLRIGSVIGGGGARAQQRKREESLPLLTRTSTRPYRNSQASSSSTSTEEGRGRIILPCFGSAARNTTPAFSSSVCRSSSSCASSHGSSTASPSFPSFGRIILASPASELFHPCCRRLSSTSLQRRQSPSKLLVPQRLHSPSPTSPQLRPRLRLARVAPPLTCNLPVTAVSDFICGVHHRPPRDKYLLRRFINQSLEPAQSSYTSLCSDRSASILSYSIVMPAAAPMLCATLPESAVSQQ